jgi:uncharacterized protein
VFSAMRTHQVGLNSLRSFAVARSLFTPTKLATAIRRLGFVQADPIRSPARAQDLTLRHRVTNYRAGDLERKYATLDIEEDFFINYGFLPRATHALMHPRIPREVWPKARDAHALAILEFVRERGSVHPREVDAHFAHGQATNWFGGTGRASTQLLDRMHYRGMLRVAQRTSGTRMYALPTPQTPVTYANPTAALDALVDVIVRKYAPLPARSLRELVSLLRGGAPQWVNLRAAAYTRATERLGSATVDGVVWYFPKEESPAAADHAPRDVVRLLAPFDPVVWDRRRFELLWGWAYRFEAYTPAHKRVRGYYALPLLWRGQIPGWANLTFAKGKLTTEIGYVHGVPPRDTAFKRALEEELEKMRAFLQ